MTLHSTQKIQMNCGQTTMDDLRQTRPVLRNQGTSQVPTTANSTQPKEGEAPSTLPEGTQPHKFVIQPTRLANNDSALDLDIFVDAYWAGCPTTRRSTTGFVTRFLGSTINFGSRTQATVELYAYAINTRLEPQKDYAPRTSSWNQG